eukprot:9279676-Alexandrium_andersonii.AAC.1
MIKQLATKNPARKACQLTPEGSNAIPTFPARKPEVQRNRHVQETEHCRKPYRSVLQGPIRSPSPNGPYAGNLCLLSVKVQQ